MHLSQGYLAGGIRGYLAGGGDSPQEFAIPTQILKKLNFGGGSSHPTTKTLDAPALTNNSIYTVAACHTELASGYIGQGIHLLVLGLLSMIVEHQVQHWVDY